MPVHVKKSIFRVLICLHFLKIALPKSFSRLHTVLSTLEDEGPQIAAAIAGGEGIKMCSLPLPLPPTPVSMLCPADVYPGPELAALGGLSFPPITHSLKPSCLSKNHTGERRQSVGLCVCFWGSACWIRKVERSGRKLRSDVSGLTQKLSGSFGRQTSSSR